ncbi:BCS1 N terminal-domain-containing protein [Blastocladiella britannica]|nr:BCS1 N terminal-domain-containing protein [Blastocladiella britannica]
MLTTTHRGSPSRSVHLGGPTPPGPSPDSGATGHHRHYNPTTTDNGIEDTSGGRSLLGSLTSALGLGGNGDGTSSAVVTLAVAGAILGAARVVSSTLVALIAQKVVVKVDLDSRDALFADFLEWLADEHDYGRNCTHLTATSKPPRLLSADRAREEMANGDSASSKAAAARPVFFFPSIGLHLFWYRSRPFLLRRERLNASGAMSANAMMETMSIVTFGRSRAIAAALFADVHAAAAHREAARTAIYTGDQYGSWRKLYTRPVRPLSSVVISTSLKDDLTSDIRTFLDSESFYATAGIPYRRGYLLYGPPGTGKTSLVTAVAGDVDLPIYVLNLSSRALTDSNVLDLLIDAPARCVMLLEDIHTVFLEPTTASSASAAVVDEAESATTSVPQPQQQQQPQQQASGVSLGTLLNILDGVIASEGRILFMTTNSVALNPAITRPGRIDRKIYLGNATVETATALADRFFPPSPALTALRLAIARFILESLPELSSSSSGSKTAVPPTTTADVVALAAVLGVASTRLLEESKVSPAQIVGFLMRFRGDPEGATAAVHEMASMHELRAIAS